VKEELAGVFLHVLSAFGSLLLIVPVGGLRLTEFRTQDGLIIQTFALGLRLLVFLVFRPIILLVSVVILIVFGILLFWPIKAIVIFLLLVFVVLLVFIGLAVFGVRLIVVIFLVVLLV
jgi:hypothetical protein